MCSTLIPSAIHVRMKKETVVPAVDSIDHSCGNSFSALRGKLCEPVFSICNKVCFLSSKMSCDCFQEMSPRVAAGPTWFHHLYSTEEADAAIAENVPATEL